MIAVDTNILLYAHRKDLPWHSKAHRAIRELAEGGLHWCIPWPCLHEFLAVATHARVFNPPSTIQEALRQVAGWAGAPSFSFIGEGAAHLDVLSAMVAEARIVGPRVHDARIAAIAQQHNVTELWTADRDFSAFPGLRLRNPLTDSE